MSGYQIYLVYYPIHSLSTIETALSNNDHQFLVEIGNNEGGSQLGHFTVDFA